MADTKYSTVCIINIVVLVYINKGKDSIMEYKEWYKYCILQVILVQFRILVDYTGRIYKAYAGKQGWHLCSVASFGHTNPKKSSLRTPKFCVRNFSMCQSQA